MTWYYRADPGKVCVVPAGYDATRFTPGDRAAARRALGLPQERPLMLFVGRIDPIKGIDVLVDALCGLRREEWMTAPPQLVVTGGNPGEAGFDALVSRARALDLMDALILVGSQPHERLPDYYRAADVVAIPSFYESFGLVAVEAMACGTPVVASRAGGLAFTVEDGKTGFLVPHSDPQALQCRLGAVLRDPALRDALGARAAVAAERFAWPTVASRVVHIYDRLIRGYRLDLCADAPPIGAALTGGA